MEKALEKANQKLKLAGEVEKSLIETNKKALELEVKAEMERLKTEVLEAKNISIAKFKEFEA